MDWTEPSFTDSARRIHGTEPGTVFPAEVTVGISGVTHNTSGYKKSTRWLVPDAPGYGRTKSGLLVAYITTYIIPNMTLYFLYSFAWQSVPLPDS